MTKDEIRIRMKDMRNSLTLEERATSSDAVREFLLDSQLYQNSNVLLSYVSFRSEVETIKIILQALADKKRVYTPRVMNTTMDFFEIHGLEELSNNHMGIAQPPEREETRYKKEKNDLQNPLMLLPGLAFDRRGNRIGYGAGYYDRYLSGFWENTFYKLALAYDFQIQEQVAAEEYDRRADAILTPTQYINCSNK